MRRSWPPGSSPLARGLRPPPWRRRAGRRIIPARAGFIADSVGICTTNSDHPRSRGVYATVEGLPHGCEGSSPLARGLRRDDAPDRVPGGIIPARAGFTRAARRAPPRAEDHPRSRGVYLRTLYPRGFRRGSSPLARGLPARLRPGRPSSRIIPARAGFTPGDEPCNRSHPDHPRSRGVYGMRTVRPGMSIGSSPLARGLLHLEVVGGLGQGIIPARAGFTATPPERMYIISDHPRSRGVYDSFVFDSETGFGSSPLARGLPENAQRNANAGRIIPARAGFTRDCDSRRRVRRDHPRSRGVYAHGGNRAPRKRGSSPLARGLLGDDGPFVHDVMDHPRSRGVYAGQIAQPLLEGGSSPLARGLPARGPGDEAAAGIIPARAGFTVIFAVKLLSVVDHPRSRGVYAVSPVGGSVLGGSSPLARGLPAWRLAASSAARIIPARAGFTWTR